MPQIDGNCRVDQRAARVQVTNMPPPGFDPSVAWQHICDLQTEILLLQRRFDALDEALKWDRNAEDL